MSPVLFTSLDTALPVVPAGSVYVKVLVMRGRKFGNAWAGTPVEVRQVSKV